MIKDTNTHKTVIGSCLLVCIFLVFSSIVSASIGENEHNPIQISDLELNPKMATLEENVKISVSVKNEGNSTASRNITLEVSGNEFETKSVSLRGGEKTQISFTFSPQTSATFDIKIGHLRDILIACSSSFHHVIEYVNRELPENSLIGSDLAHGDILSRATNCSSVIYEPIIAGWENNWHKVSEPLYSVPGRHWVWEKEWENFPCKKPPDYLVYREEGYKHVIEQGSRELREDKINGRVPDMLRLQKVSGEKFAKIVKLYKSVRLGIDYFVFNHRYLETRALLSQVRSWKRPENYVYSNNRINFKLENSVISFQPSYPYRAYLKENNKLRELCVVIRYLRKSENQIYLSRVERVGSRTEKIGGFDPEKWAHKILALNYKGNGFEKKGIMTLSEEAVPKILLGNIKKIPLNTCIRSGYKVPPWLEVKYKSPNGAFSLVKLAIKGGNRFTLSTSLDPPDAGIVSLDPPKGPFEQGTELTVTADPSEGYEFDHWEGNYPSGHKTDKSISVTMSSDKSLTAHFVKKQEIEISIEDLEVTNNYSEKGFLGRIEAIFGSTALGRNTDARVNVRVNPPDQVKRVAVKISTPSGRAFLDKDRGVHQAGTFVMERIDGNLYRTNVVTYAPVESLFQFLFSMVGEESPPLKAGPLQVEKITVTDINGEKRTKSYSDVKVPTVLEGLIAGDGGTVAGMACPAHLCIVTQNGELGSDGEEIYREINGFYRKTENFELVAIPSSVKGYKIKISGYEKGTYDLYSLQIGNGGIKPILQKENISTEPGETNVYNIKKSSKDSEKDLPLTWIAVGVGVIVAVIGGVVVAKKRSGRSGEGTVRGKETASEAKYCPNCGAEVKPKTKFCPQCGEEVD